MAILSSIGTVTGLVYLRRVDAPNSPPPGERTVVLPMQRAGVAGTAFNLQAVKGQPFQMESMQTAASLANAVAYEATYKALIGTGPLAIVWGGTNITYAKYVVLDVVLLTTQKTSAATAGAAYAKALWTLMPVADT